MNTFKFGAVAQADAAGLPGNYDVLRAEWYDLERRSRQHGGLTPDEQARLDDLRASLPPTDGATDAT